MGDAITGRPHYRKQEKMEKFGVKILQTAVTAVLVTTAFTVFNVGASGRLDGIAAVVGDEIIMNSELEAYAYMRVSAMGIDPQDVDAKELMLGFLNELIDNKVLLVQAREDSTISVRSDEVENTLNNHISMILQQNGITLAQLESQLSAQQGTTLARFKSEARRTIREQLLKQKLQQSYYFSTQINRRDVEKFYAEYSDSLPQVGESFELSKLSAKLAPSDSVRGAAFSKIQSIKNQLNAGANFEELAKEHSESPEGAAGGDLGYISKGSTTELAFEERAFTMDVGQISEPFETRLGYHIIQVVEKRDRRVRLRQILVRLTPAERQLEEIAARLDSLGRAVKNQSEFEAAARSMSADHVTRAKGGFMGWVSLFDVSPVVRGAIKDLEDGQISAPVTEGDMMSVYRVNKRADSRKLTLENDYPAIAEKARDIFAQKKLLETVGKWREKVFIDIRI
ncbi:MAG: peptidylprolyl isomerase [Chitinispirillales bacterium]|jgi:peptidyl-prolyl cis-trans isomerase SurA|nr:peptidylprolyl isomerase [Chitinispirillales bacterium]